MKIFERGKKQKSIPYISGSAFRRQGDKQGFSLVETLVAVFILTLSITAFIAVATGGLRSSFFARDRVVASFLAQEAVEVIKNQRDENGLANCDPNCEDGNNVHWLSGIADWAGGPCGEAQDCGVDSRNTSSTQIGSCAVVMNDCILKRDSNGVFHHDNDGDDTKFTRKIRIFRAGDLNNEAKVTVTVSWGQGLGSGEVVVSEHIYNWHPLSETQ
jgi:type II secretory pathway pseudopilin PulG